MHCWSEEHSLETWRAYNYPHVATVYWALYRLGRHFSPPLTKRADWKFYLEQAGRTIVAMYKFGGRGTSTCGPPTTALAAHAARASPMPRI